MPQGVLISPLRMAMRFSETLPMVPVMAAVRLGVLMWPPPEPGGHVEEHRAFFQRERAGIGVEGKDGVLADADDGMIGKFELGAGLVLREEIGLRLRPHREERRGVRPCRRRSPRLT